MIKNHTSPTIWSKMITIFIGTNFTVVLLMSFRASWYFTMYSIPLNFMIRIRTLRWKMITVKCFTITTIMNSMCIFTSINLTFSTIILKIIFVWTIVCSMVTVLISTMFTVMLIMILCTPSCVAHSYFRFKNNYIINFNQSHLYIWEFILSFLNKKCFKISSIYIFLKRNKYSYAISILNNRKLAKLNTKIREKRLIFILNSL